MSIDKFISEVKTRGLSRLNRFEVQLGVPRMLVGKPFNVPLIQLFCEQTSLPGLNYSTSQIRTYGEQREMPYDKIYDPISLTFIVDSRMDIKKFFDLWIDSVMSPDVRNYYYYNDYISDIEIIVKDLQDLSMYSLVLKEAYPKTMQQITLDNGSKDVMRLSITFTYKFFIKKEWYKKGGEAELRNQPVEISNGITPSNYNNGTLGDINNLSEDFLNNNISQQERFNDSISIARATQQFERRGYTIGKGGTVTS